ncbi:CBS domain-containing protein [archaeon]|nr:CBS domain-containing protein [archaeon]
MSMKIKEIMNSELVTITPDKSVTDAAKKMIKYGISGLVVTKSGFELVGIVTEKDLLKAFLKKNGSDKNISEVMTKKIITVKGNDTLEDAAKIMIKNHIKRLPVTDKTGETCIGIVTATDLMRYEDQLVEKLSVLFLTQQNTVGGG